jgi:hypothetical protein
LLGQQITSLGTTAHHIFLPSFVIVSHSDVLLLESFAAVNDKSFEP